MDKSIRLLRQFVATRSETAFKELVDTHVKPVYSVATRVLNGDTALAEDVTQTVFADLVKRADSISSGSNLESWLCRRAFFIASTKVREEQRRRAREFEAVRLNSVSGRGDEWCSEDICRTLHQTLQNLRPRDRDVLVLRYLCGWDLKRVGEAFGITDDSAQKRVSRALDRLRQSLSAAGYPTTLAWLVPQLSTEAVAEVPPTVANQVATAVLSGSARSSGLAADWLAAVASFKGKGVMIGAMAVVMGLVLATTSRYGGVVEGVAPFNIGQAGAQAGASGYETQDIHGSRVRFRWSVVESDDAAKLAENLRRTGCPEQTVIDILVGRLNRAYAPRFQSIWNPEPTVFWRRNLPQEPSAEQSRALHNLASEKWAELKGATGAIMTSQDIGNLVYLELSKSDEELAFLDERTRDAAERALKESGLHERMEAVRPHSDGRELFGSRLQALKQVLDARQLTEYRVRNSPRAQRLRDSIAYFDCSNEEFVALLNLIDQALDAHPGTLAVDRETELANARVVFGPLRAAEYERVTDHGYLNTRRKADRVGLPPGVADVAATIARDARVELEATARDRSLSTQERLSTIANLQHQAEQRMLAALGSAASPGIIQSMRLTLANTAALARF